MATQQNLIPNDPELADLIKLLIKEVKLGLNCHHIGKIESFDASKQTASATITYKKTYFKPSKIPDIYEPVLVDYPILLDCPVICLGGGAGSLEFPIEKGDECVVLFNDRDIDNWFQGGSGSATATLRLHSFSDGLILVGVRSLGNVLTEYQTDAVTLKKGNSWVRLTGDEIRLEFSTGVALVLTSAGKFKIQGLSDELVAVINQLFLDVQAATTNTLMGPQPLVMPTFAADLLKLVAFLEVGP